MRLKLEANIGGDLLSVAITQHLSKGHDLGLAATHFAGLFKVAFSPNTFDDVLAFELLFHATDCAVNWLVLADFDFEGHVA